MCAAARFDDEQVWTRIDLSKRLTVTLHRKQGLISVAVSYYVHDVALIFL